MGVKDWSPDLIRKSHVRQAAKFWREQGSYRPFKNSVSYDVVVGGKLYPPKAIASKAHELATGRPLLPSEFVGAKDGVWHRQLASLGFQIVEKGSDASIASDVAASLKLSREQRLKRIAAAAPSKPRTIKVEVTRYLRSPDVVAERLYLARGKCEACGEKAPFLRQIDRTPYLEVHHIEPLSCGGLDTVENTQALCPNCHSEVHDRLRVERQVE